MTHTSPSNWIEKVRSALEGQGRRPVIDYLQRQRWFGGKGKPLTDVRLLDAFELSTGVEPCLVGVLLVEYRGGDQERYMVPLSVGRKVETDNATAIAECPAPSELQWVRDATREDEVWQSLHEIVAMGREVLGEAGSLQGRTMAGRADDFAAPVKAVKVLSSEQSNTSVVFDKRVIMKLIRKVEMGLNPDSEVLEFLTTKTECGVVPPLLGVMTYRESHAEEAIEGTVGVVQQFVPNKGDGWSHVLARLDELLGKMRGRAWEPGDALSKTVRSVSKAFIEEIRHLGLITGNLHVALASRSEPGPFQPEPITVQDVERWQWKMSQFLMEVCRDLRVMSVDQQAAVGISRAEADALETACRDRFGDLMLLARAQTAKVRHHGDYHLGQVLKTDDGFVVIDFEGEPARPLEERRAKVCPLKDVAGMLRSFDYAAQALLKRDQSASETDVAVVRAWEVAARETFLEGYRSVARPGQVLFLPAAWADAMRILRVYEIDKALYELRYELRNRPDWLSIPLQGIRRLVRERAA